MSVSVCLSVCLSVTEVHWRIIANLGFKFRSHFTAHCGIAALRVAGGSSRAMLASRAYVRGYRGGRERVAGTRRVRERGD